MEDDKLATFLRDRNVPEDIIKKFTDDNVSRPRNNMLSSVSDEGL